MPGKKQDPPVPSTISDKKWGKVQRAAARAVPYVELPGSDPKAVAKKRAWEDAPKHAKDN